MGKTIRFTKEELELLGKVGFTTNNQIIGRPLYFTGANYGKVYYRCVAWLKGEDKPTSFISKRYERDSNGNQTDKIVFTELGVTERSNNAPHYAYCSTDDRKYYFQAYNTYRAQYLIIMTTIWKRTIMSRPNI